MLLDNDFFSPYGRTFFEPEHGRYIASYLNHILTEVLPEIFNIHPMDFQNIFVSPLKILVIILCFLCLSNTAFLFSKDNNTLLKPPVSNIAFTAVYAVIFLILFNDNYFFSNTRVYFNIFQNTVFWEYSASIWLYVLFSGIIGFYFVKKESFSNFNYAVLLICAFFLGISVEVLNLPAFALLSILGIYLFLKKELNRGYIILFAVYTASLLCFYANANNHAPVYRYDFFTYLTVNIIPFITGYITEFIGQSSILLLPIAVLFILNSFIYKNTEESAQRCLIFTASGTAGFMIFFALMFFGGFTDARNYHQWYVYEKFIYVYKTVLLFYLLFVLSFFLDSRKIKPNISSLIKIIVCILVLTVFHKNLIIDYYQNINKTVQYYKALKTAAYKSEKYAAEGKENFILLPKHFKTFKHELAFYKNSCGFQTYLHSVHPEINKNEIVFSRKFSSSVTFSEKELEELKFSNLLKHKMHRHKKDLKYCRN